MGTEFPLAVSKAKVAAESPVAEYPPAKITTLPIAPPECPSSHRERQRKLPRLRQGEEKDEEEGAERGQGEGDCCS